MAEQRRVITLITDYGEKGPFAGALKGAILNINPDAQVVDITHSVSSGDILEAGFILSCAYRYYPVGTIHIVVVDPKVGSERRALLISTENHYFLAPDNGVLSYVFAREEIYNAISLTEDHFFLKPTSHTFHGRDIFAPVAAWLSRNVESARFGEPVEDYLRLDIPRPAAIRDKAWKGTVLFVDNFGNLITNFTPEEVPLDEQGYPAVAKVLHTRGEITKTRRYFAEFTEREPFLLLGSSGYYEIAINNGSAAQELGLKAGSDVGVLLR